MLQRFQSFRLVSDHLLQLRILSFLRSQVLKLALALDQGLFPLDHLAVEPFDHRI